MLFCTISVQKAYHSLSLETHPDRVAEAEKIAATQKFQVLSKLYTVLTNREKKQLFDERGIIDDMDDDSLPASTFLIKPEHIENCKRLFMGKNYSEISKFGILNCLEFVLTRI